MSRGARGWAGRSSPASNKTGLWIKGRPNSSDDGSSSSRSMSRVYVARAAARSIGRGWEKIEWPDLDTMSKGNTSCRRRGAYCRMTIANLPNWMALRATSKIVSNISSSLLVLPHPAKKMTRRVITQNAVITRSMMFHNDVQNCYGHDISPTRRNHPIWYALFQMPQSE